MRADYISMSIEPIVISNPLQYYYKFLFNGKLDEQNTNDALDFINTWLEEHGWAIKSERRRDIAEHGYFEISVKIMKTHA
jgi:hypothetical protein